MFRRPRHGVLGLRLRRRWASSTLVHTCKCGQSGCTATGPSHLNFTCHCSICRAAAGTPSLSAAAFPPEQVEVRGLVAREVPGASINPRVYCAQCRTYLAEESHTLGVVAVPTPAHDCPAEFAPNHHLFYKDRVQDVADSLPKWKAMLHGEIDTPYTECNTVTKEGSGLAGAPTTPAQPEVYQFPESDPTPSHKTRVPRERVRERVDGHKYIPADTRAYVAPVSPDPKGVVIIGGGHNGLVTAAYLARAGLPVTVLERRHLVGGAAVTEELYPGFKFSRAAYLAGLFRPHIIEDLELRKYGFHYIPRDPSSFTPALGTGPYLLLGSNDHLNRDSIAQFSDRDAQVFAEYEAFLGRCRDLVTPLLDSAPPLPVSGTLRDRLAAMKTLNKVATRAMACPEALVPLYELFTAPVSKILDRWFESDVLKSTLAVDAVIGAMVGPHQPASAYVLLHHVMGESPAGKGVWSYVRGGMGAVSTAIARSAEDAGASIHCNARVAKIDVNVGRVKGVVMDDGSYIKAGTVISNATPYHTFLELMDGGQYPEEGGGDPMNPLATEFQNHIRFADYSCGALKINLAVDRLPNFTCCPNTADGLPGPQHHGTIHFENCIEDLDRAFRQASAGVPADRPVIDMTIPSALDRTLAPEGQHVVQLFVQYAPYDIDPKVGSWADPQFKDSYADKVLRIVEQYCPGFMSSVLYRDVLSPLDLERIFGLHKGNIMHGALSLHQLGYARPHPQYSDYRTPITSLYLCGAGTHPGGGVMGAAGHNCAQAVLNDR